MPNPLEGVDTSNQPSVIVSSDAHAGLKVEGDWDSYNDNIAQFVLEVPFWTHRTLWQLLLSGKFDRFPGLKYAVVECGSYWLGDLLWKADTTFGANTKVKKLNSRTNVGVTSGGGGLPWQQEPNDWRWCFGVSVFGVGIGVSEFLPRMIDSGKPGQVVVTSSGDGGFAPVATASVYAASKAAVTCFTAAVQLNLVKEGSAVRAPVFYPSGGLMDTGLYTATRNRPTSPSTARYAATSSSPTTWTTPPNCSIDGPTPSDRPSCHRRTVWGSERVPSSLTSRQR